MLIDSLIILTTFPFVLKVRECQNLPSCNWSNWGEWSNCSSNCREDHKQRTRHCIDFQGNPVDNDYCVGSRVERVVCDACRSEHDWTDWHITDINQHEVIEQRNEKSSNEVVPFKSQQRVVPLKYCDRCEGYVYNFKNTEYLM